LFGAFLGEYDVAIPAQTICSLLSELEGQPGGKISTEAY